MNKKKIIMLVSAVVALVAVTVATLTTAGLAKIDKSTSFRMKLMKPDIVDGFFVGYNNWKFVMRNNGSYFYDSPDLDHNANNAGGEFPRGSNRTIVYAAGLYVATKKATATGDTQVVSETEFATEFRPGFITNSNVPFRSLTRDNHLAASNRVYIVHKEDADGSKGDWTNWPGDHQANGDPALIGSAVTWAVFNDVDTLISSEGVAASPLPGIGVQVELQSISIDEGKLADVVFIRMKIINKTNVNYANSYVGLWMDADVNNSSNDIVGVDTVAGLGFVYDSEDEVNPAATGFDFFQGPVVDVLTIPTALATRFAGNNTTLVYNPALNAFTVTPLPAGKIWLGATSFNTYANGTDPTNNKERYYLLEGKNKTTGAPKTGTGVNYKYAFPGNPLTGQGTVNVAAASDAADQRILHGVGPFVMNANDSIEMWAGVVGGEGATRLGAFAVMKTTDAYAQTIFNAGLSYPTAPDVPAITVTPLDGKVAITWDDRVEYTTADVFGERAGLLVSNGYSANYEKHDFQGYRVYKSLTGLPGTYEAIAQYDIIDGHKDDQNVFVDNDGYIAVGQEVYGTDNGLQYSYVDHEVTNGQPYFYAVAAFDRQPYIGITGSPVSMPGGGFAAGPIGMPISLESSLTANVVKVVPKSAVAGSAFDGGVTKNSFGADSVAHFAGTSDGSVSIEIIDPNQLRAGTYTVEFFDVPGDSQGHPLVNSFTGDTLDGFLAYRFLFNNTLTSITSQKDNPSTFWDFNGNMTYNAGVDVPLDETKFATRISDPSDPLTLLPTMLDGMAILVYGPALNFKNFEVVANANGALSPSRPAAFGALGFPTPGGGNPSTAGQSNGSLWAIHTAEVGAGNSYDAFISRTTRDGDNWSVIIPHDFEVRFTAGVNRGYDWYGDFGNVETIPFELWDIGVATPTNTSDDHRLIPFLLDDGTVTTPGTFDLSTPDHTASGGLNDPHTDWIYWFAPTDESPGSAGYDAAAAQMVALGAGYGAEGVDHEIMARMVFVGWNLGLGPTYTPNMPETGTVFRITSTKPNANDDKYRFTTVVNKASTEKADVKDDMKNIRVVPNPYYGRSDYQQSLFDKQVKFTHLPSVCTIKIFTVSGDLVTTLNHNASSNNDRDNNNPLDLNFAGNDQTTSVERWNLQNAGGKFVASGMYIAVIEAKGKGKKIVKFAVIQEEITINGPDVR